MKPFKLLVLLYALACVSCSKSYDDEKNDDYVTLSGDYVALKMKDICIIPNDNNAMKFSIIDVSDNRCPKSICYLCYGSEAHILVSITDSKNVKTETKLSIIGCVDELDNDIGYDFVDTLGYRFRLVQLSPYPDVDPINKNDYTAKIKITKL